MSYDRGATEVLGYILVISLVTVVIALVMTTGISGLESSQQSEQINNMERGFDVLSHNIDTMADRDAPSRATELRIAEGSINYGETSTINVSHEGMLLGDETISTEPIEYDSGTDIKIVYEHGAVIREDGDHSTMLSPPPFMFKEGNVVIQGIRTRPLGGSATEISDPGTVLLRGEYLGTRSYTSDVSPEENIEIEVVSERPTAWEQYFSSFDQGEVSRDDNTVTFTVQVDEDTKLYSVQTRTRFTLV